jgi:hypothetical protein
MGMMDTQLIIRQFELPEAEDGKVYTEAEIEALLADQVAWMLEYRLEYLLSLMYRLDIDEKKITEVLMPGAPVPAHLGLTRLILDRQKQRMETKAAYREQNPDNWSWE